MKTQTIMRTRQNARAAEARKQSTQKSTTRGPRCGSSDGEGSPGSSESPPSSGTSDDNIPNSCFGDLSSLIDHHVAAIHKNLNKRQKRQRLMQNRQNIQEASTASMNTSDIASPEHDGEESGIPQKHSRRTRSTAASGGVHQKQSSKNNDNSNSNITTRNVENSDNVTGRSNMDQLYLQFMSKANRHSSGGEKTTEPGSSAQRKPYDLRMRNTASFQEGCVGEPEVIAQEPETSPISDVTNLNMAGTPLSNDVIQRDVTEQDVEACVQKLLQVFAQYDRISEETSRLKERAEHQFLVTL